MYDMEQVLRERKTARQGMKFKPSVWAMLKELAVKRKLSMADLLERLIIDEYKRELKERD